MFTRHSIILVDDEMELVSLFREFLEREGHKVVSFSNPLLALEYFKETSAEYSLLLADMRMRGLRGIDLAKSFREVNKAIKIFLMTAFDIRDIEQHPSYKEARINRLLLNPVRFVELKRMINDTLGVAKQ